MNFVDIEEKQHLEAVLCEKLRGFTISGLHDAFEVIRSEVGDYYIQKWLKGERV